MRGTQSEFHRCVVDSYFNSVGAICSHTCICVTHVAQHAVRHANRGGRRIFFRLSIRAPYPPTHSIVQYVRHVGLLVGASMSE